MASKAVKSQYLSDWDNSSDEENSAPQLSGTMDLNTEESSEESDDQKISAYEEMRLRNIQEREQMMRELGIKDAVDELKVLTALRKEKTSARKRVKIEHEPLPKREPSRRLRNKSAENFKLPETEIKIEKEEEVEDKDERLLGSMPMAIANQESEDLLMRLGKLKWETNCDLDLNPSDIHGFQKKLSSYCFTNGQRVFCNRIQSLEVHPTAGKKLVIAGSIEGEIGLWDVELDSTATFKPHSAPVNCLSVSISEPTKFFSTSHDGTFVCGDLKQTLFSSVYATDYYDQVRHLTWHDQLDPNRLLLAHDVLMEMVSPGSGSIGMLDLRDPKVVNSWYPCFNLSAWTVQHHPINDNYFLVSSGAGSNQSSSNVYDLRKCSSSEAEPVSEFSHPKGLTSAFFSPSGDQVLTTCNDRCLRIYTSPLQAKPSLKISIPHKIVTNPWLSVFKAKWYPGRDDSFVIGSLMSPRRIQIYGINGKLIKVLRDADRMTTITPVISVHPILPLVAGGNSSGRVYLFSSKDEEPET